MTIGEKILTMRKARGWSQEELADKIGVSRQAVSRWEADSAKPDADKIIAICNLFGVSADYLLRETGDPGPAVGAQRKTNALSAAIRNMNLSESVCGAISLTGILVCVILLIISGFKDFYGSDAVDWLFYTALAAIFVWPMYRFLRWTNS